MSKHGNSTEAIADTQAMKDFEENPMERKTHNQRYTSDRKNPSAVSRISKSTRIFFKYLVNEPLRWIILSIGFMFLLGMAFTLVEIVSFQGKVANIVNDEEATVRVMKRLDDIHSKGANSLDEGTLPYGAIAVMLDRLNTASNQLNSIKLLPREKVAGEDSSSKEPADGNHDDEIKSELANNTVQGIYNSIHINVEDIKRVLKENSSELVLIELFDQLRLQSYELAQFGPIQESDLTQISSRDKQKIAYAQCQDPSSAIRWENGTIVCADELKEIPAAADTTNRPEMDTNINGATARTGLERIEKSLLQLTNDLEDKISPRNSNIAISEEIGKFADLTRQLSRHIDNPLIVKRSAAAPEPGLDLEEIGHQFSNSISGISSILVDQNQEMGIARKIAAEITAIEQSADLLATAGNQFQFSYTPANSNVAMSNSRSQSVYEDAVSKVRASLGELENVLQDRTPVFSLSTAMPENPKANTAAKTILESFNGLNKFSPFLHPFFWTQGWWIDLSGIGVDPLSLATLDYDALTLLIVFVMGALGSLVYVSKSMLHSSLLGIPAMRRRPKPLSWMFFRPIFGVVMALAVFLVVKALQFAFAGSAGPSNSVLNLAIFSIVALFSGLMSWQAVEAIESKGSALFTGKIRRDQYATGMINAMRNQGLSEAELSHQIGRTTEQIQRWTQFEDKVNPELQDRITSCLERPRDELFSDTRPDTVPDQMPLWGVGLSKALDNASMDAETMAELLKTSNSRIHNWLNLETLVPPASQWSLVGILKMTHSDLFSKVHPDDICYAYGLRSELLHKHRDTKWLANQIGANRAHVQRWAEMQSSVPYIFREKILSALNSFSSRMYKKEKLSTDDYFWASGVKEAMSVIGAGNITATKIAEDLDLSLEQVRSWIEMDNNEYGMVSPQTQRRLRDYIYKIANGVEIELENKKIRLFSSQRPSTDFSWAPGLKAAVENMIKQNDMELSNVAEKIDVSTDRLNRWIDMQEQVPPFSQQQLVNLLDPNNDGSKLFSRFKKAS